MRIEDVTSGTPSPEAIERGVKALERGGVLAIPTDTVYGLGADASYTGASDRIFELKKRSRNFELPVLVSDVEQAMEITFGVPDAAVRLMDKFWPGGLTIVLPRAPEFVADLGSDDDTVGVRCPHHPLPRLLCGEVGPLATTSANLHKQPTLTTAQAVADTFGNQIDLIYDGGTCEGSPSTVIDFTGNDPKLLRDGRIPWTEIQAVLDA